MGTGGGYRIAAGLELRLFHHRKGRNMSGRERFVMTVAMLTFVASVFVVVWSIGDLADFQSDYESRLFSRVFGYRCQFSVGLIFATLALFSGVVAAITGGIIDERSKKSGKNRAVCDRANSYSAVDDR